MFHVKKYFCAIIDPVLHFGKRLIFTFPMLSKTIIFYQQSIQFLKTCTSYNYIIITSYIIPRLQGRYVEALQDVSAAIHLDPNGAPAFYHRACLLRTSQPEQALRDLSVSLLLDDSVANVSAYVHRGVLYTQMKWSANFSVLQCITYSGRV